MNGLLKEIQDRLHVLSSDMNACGEKLRRGEAVDLIPLQARIGDISVEVINARPQSTCFLPSLKHLVVQLDDLALALKQQRDKVH